MKLGRLLGLQLIKQAAIEPETTQSVSYEHLPEDEEQKERTVDTLHAFTTHMEQLTDQVPYLNFRGSDMHYADRKYATSRRPSRVWDYGYWAQYNDEKTEHADLPGKKPVVRDSKDELNAENVWDEHDAYEMNKNIIDYVANPGPAV